MAKPKDMLGQRFSRLVITAFEGSRNGFAQWRCVCDCGTETVVLGSRLRCGKTTSCGCALRQRAKELCEAKRMLPVGATQTPEYRAWRAMRYRCRDNGNKQWKDYGGRGVCVSPKWDSFAVFLCDVGVRPSPKHSLDRIDNDGNYEPGNVRWATITEQANNRRTNRITAILGEPMTVTDAARKLGLNPRKVLLRLHQGWTEERALS